VDQELSRKQEAGSEAQPCKRSSHIVRCRQRASTVLKVLRSRNAIVHCATFVFPIYIARAAQISNTRPQSQA